MDNDLQLDNQEQLDNLIDDIIDGDTNADFLEELLDNGLSPNYVTPHGILLLYAIEVNNIDVVKILLEKGAYPLMMSGTIPLELAMNEGHYEIADLLHEYSVSYLAMLTRITTNIQSKRRLTYKKRRTNVARQRLALMRSIHSRQGPIGTVRYDPSLMENISQHLSTIKNASRIIDFSNDFVEID